VPAPVKTMQTEGAGVEVVVESADPQAAAHPIAIAETAATRKTESKVVDIMDQYGSLPVRLAMFRGCARAERRP